jgi:hypothetical protein
LCSAGDSAVASTEASNAALTQELGKDYATTFGESQAIQAQLKGVLTNQLTNPTGLGADRVAAMRTGVTDTTAQQYEGATRAANAVSAAHGGAGLPSGVSAQVGGQIAAGAAQANSAEQGQISVADAQAKQANYWNAISGLGQVGAAYNPTATSNSAASVGSSTANLGSTLLASQQAGWQDISGVIGAVGGLATGAAGVISANPGGIFGA